MLRQWFNRYSMLAQTFIILVVTITVAGSMMFVLMTSTVSRVVTNQVREGTQNTLDVAVNQLGSLTSLSNSILISLKTDEGLQRALQKEPSTLYERQLLFDEVQSVLNQSYYLLAPDINIAIVSQYDDVYANWTTFKASSLQGLKKSYEEQWEKGKVPVDSIWASLARDVALLDNQPDQEDYYVQYIPLESFGRQTLDGVAMVLIPERTLYESVRFAQKGVHNTFVIDRTGTVVSAGNRGFLGLPIDFVLKSMDVSGSLRLTSPAAYRQRLSVIDIMSGNYVKHQTWLIVGRVAVYSACSMLAIMAACYFIMLGITRPLVQLTQKMVESDYNTFVRDNAADLGRNEITLMEHGFEVMGENIESLIVQNREKEQQKRRIELAALQSQIQPHFLFNTLNTVRCSIINKHNDKAANLVYDLTMLLRMTLMKGDELIMLRQELENIGYYLGIISMRHAALFEYTENLAPGTEELMIPKLLLQPVVDHEIDLRSAKISSADRFSGIGTVNVNNRLKLYFGEEPGLRIYADEENWTVSELKIMRSGEDRTGADEYVLKYSLTEQGLIEVMRAIEKKRKQRHLTVMEENQYEEAFYRRPGEGTGELEYRGCRPD